MPALAFQPATPAHPESGQQPALKERVVSFTRELGFDSCRVTAAAAPRHTGEFRKWLREGAAGEMGWMARGEEKRADPQKILAGARSIIVLAMNYWQGDPPAAREGIRTGRIARYAWGDDYHDLINSKLRELDKYLRSQGGSQKCYVDTGPLLERDHAAEAGTGWHGKSTMLVDRRLGTWFFLAEILTTLQLPPDAPQTGRCGACTRCLSACPTGALRAPHSLDARLCISYLTIESKSAIPPELRPLIGDRIYGCDDCLDACPWNRFAKVSREAAFAARSATTAFSLRDYLSLDDDQFRALFRNSPIKRIKRRGFLRNVCVALGNVGDTGDIPALERAAGDPEQLIAEHARWALEQIRERTDQRKPLETLAALCCGGQA